MGSSTGGDKNTRLTQSDRSYGKLETFFATIIPRRLIILRDSKERPIKKMVTDFNMDRKMSEKWKLFLAIPSYHHDPKKSLIESIHETNGTRDVNLASTTPHNATRFMFAETRQNGQSD